MLCAFDIDLSNVSAKKLLQQQWGIQTNTKFGLQKLIMCYLQNYYGKNTGHLCTKLYHHLHINKPRRGSTTAEINEW
jgi:hypothetical protein